MPKLKGILVGRRVRPVRMPAQGNQPERTVQITEIAVLASGKEFPQVLQVTEDSLIKVVENLDYFQGVDVDYLKPNFGNETVFSVVAGTKNQVVL